MWTIPAMETWKLIIDYLLQAPELSAEEQLHRLKKAEAIRKMLSETTSITTSDSKGYYHSYHIIYHIIPGKRKMIQIF